MPFLAQHIVAVILGAALLIFLATGALIIFAILRHTQRQNYLRAVDKIQKACGPIIGGLLTGTLDYNTGQAELQRICGREHLLVLGQLLVAASPGPSGVPIRRQLCDDLGLVLIWQQRLAGHFDERSLGGDLARPDSLLERLGALSFVLRAESAHSLGAIRHEPSWPLLATALDDPNLDVRSVAARALGTIQAPASLAALVERLQAVVLAAPGAGTLSVRHIRAILAGFPLENAIAFLPALAHDHPRVRYLATDIVRGMVERETAANGDLPLRPDVFRPELAEAFLGKLAVDVNPDVRARAAPVIARLEYPRSVPVLAKLLDDSQWFVRLHTLRAIANPGYCALTEMIAQRLSDPHWRVREAAARTLVTLGQAGIDCLLDLFSQTQDRYSREQVAEELERTGLIPVLLQDYGSAEHQRETRAIEHLAEMGKTSTLLGILLKSPEPEQRRKLAGHLASHPHPQVRAFAQQLRAREIEPYARPARVGGRS